MIETFKLTLKEVYKKMTEQKRSSNDNRSDSFNPNNNAEKASRDNRANQLNPNHPEYKRSK